MGMAEQLFGTMHCPCCQRSMQNASKAEAARVEWNSRRAQGIEDAMLILDGWEGSRSQRVRLERLLERARNGQD